MSNFKISVISDALFVLFSSFLTSFTIAFYLLKNNVFSILIAIPISVIFFCAYALIYKKKKGRLAVKREDEERFLKCTNALCLATDEENVRRVFLTLERLDKKPFFTEDGILCEGNFFFTNFSYDSATIGNVADAYKKTPQGKNLIYLGVNFTEDAKNFADGFYPRIKLIPLSEFFPLLQKALTLPECGFLPKRKKMRSMFRANIYAEVSVMATTSVPKRWARTRRQSERLRWFCFLPLCTLYISISLF